jgi:hypothetical protein
MESNGRDAVDIAEEVIFVLRLRARKAGWRGQVKRLDNGSLRYVASQPELYALLESDWLLAAPREEVNSKGGD